jgi:lipopolysaccharide export system protein LptC
MFKSFRFVVVTPKNRYKKIYSWNKPKLQHDPIKSHWGYELPKLDANHLFNQWSGWILLLGLALGTTWFVYQMENNFSSPTTQASVLPDYTLEKFTSIQMDEQGQLKNQLTAETMIHYPQINTKLTLPYIVFYRNTQPLWQIWAEQGEVSPDGNQVWLLGQTTLLRQMENKKELAKPPLKIFSRDVWVQLAQQYAETAAHSLIINGDNQIQGIGMQVFMPRERVELLSQVRGYYVPLP